jgi:hypothetical protein
MFKVFGGRSLASEGDVGPLDHPHPGWHFITLPAAERPVFNHPIPEQVVVLFQLALHLLHNVFGKGNGLGRLTRLLVQSSKGAPHEPLFVGEAIGLLEDFLDGRHFLDPVGYQLLFDPLEQRAAGEGFKLGASATVPVPSSTQAENGNLLRRGPVALQVRDWVGLGVEHVLRLQPVRQYVRSRSPRSITCSWLRNTYRRPLLWSVLTIVNPALSKSRSTRHWIPCRDNSSTSRRAAVTDTPLVDMMAMSNRSASRPAQTGASSLPFQ